MTRVTTRSAVLRVDLDEVAGRATLVRRPDTLAAEEPLEIRVRAFGDTGPGEALTITMRTPGADFDLTLGLLVGEGLLAQPDDVTHLRHCTDLGDDGRPTFNVVQVSLAPGVPMPPVSLRRSFAATSACGVCGKASIESLRTRSPFDLARDDGEVAAEVLTALPGTLRRAQVVFERTGGLHAAALFDAAGGLRCLREDVGRHNAVDKVVGWAVRERLLPLRAHVLLVSGRASFELVQKAVMAGIPVLAAVSAPSSLAVQTAEAADLTLVGFLRGRRFNVYSATRRITVGARDDREVTEQGPRSRMGT